MDGVTVAALTATAMAKKKETADSKDAVLKVEKELYRQLSVLAAHKGMSVKALADPVLREFVQKERPKMLAEMQDEE